MLLKRTRINLIISKTWIYLYEWAYICCNDCIYCLIIYITLSWICLDEQNTRMNRATYDTVSTLTLLGPKWAEEPISFIMVFIIFILWDHFFRWLIDLLYPVPDNPLGGVGARLRAPFVLGASWKRKTVFFSSNYTYILFTNLRDKSQYEYHIVLLCNKMYFVDLVLVTTW